jgi:predicted aldo/keto reductase-like oxidoreductase
MDNVIDRHAANHLFDKFTQTVDRAEDCLDCGECEEKCPYNLPIREMIYEHVALFRREMAKSGFI